MAQAKQVKVREGRPPRCESDLDFKRKPMVGWFAPKQLTGTGIKVLLSSLFGAYADKREMQAALHRSHETAQHPHDYSKNNQIYFDFIGDTGDGWDSTYTMARLLAEPYLNLGGEVVPQGQIVILGGDQVYPAAKREEYNDRFIGPFKSALPCEKNGQSPDMYAVPGNHDWYDGLTSFIRLFCQERTIGGWRTKQKYSYFAIKLPHRWWLWAIDIQFEADIDEPQLDYFENIASKHFDAGDRVILCNATPSWTEASVPPRSSRRRRSRLWSWVRSLLKASAENPVAFKNLIYCEQELIRKHGGEAVLMLSGDLHHYCRYSAQGGVRQKITSGGGGAYLYPTHRMPQQLHLKEELESAHRTGEHESPPVIYRREDNPFPSVRTSRLLRFGVLLFPFKNLKFCLLLCSLYLVFAWLLESGSQKLPESFMEQVSMFSPLEAGHIQGIFWSFLESVKHSPSSVLFMLAIVLGLIAFSGLNRFPFGLLHGTAHIGLNIYLIWNFTYLNKQVFSMTRIDQIPHAILFSAEMFAIGGILGGLLMGLYLFLSELLTGLHTNEVFSAQRIADHKSFLRLQIDEKGDLRIFPVGVARICRKWKFNPDAADGQPWFEPEDGSIGSRAHLIEGPILIKSASASN